MGMGAHRMAAPEEPDFSRRSGGEALLQKARELRFIVDIYTGLIK